MSLISEARQLATTAHAGMLYHKTTPYTYHLDRVEDVLLRFRKASTALRCAAWLHDTLEDTALTIRDIENRFPPEVVRLVDAVTDLPGNDRAERKTRSYPKLWAAGADAITLKLADRIANVEASLSWGTRHLTMYRDEYTAFYRALFEPEDNDEMWDHLDRLLVRVDSSIRKQLSQ